MSKEAQRVAILSHVKSIWLPAFGGIAYPNVPFSTPGNERWAEVFIQSDDDSRVSLGREFLKRHLGSLQFNLYCPQDMGSKENTVAADYLEGVYEELRLETSVGEIVQFGTPHSFGIASVEERREGTNSNWYRYVIDCPFSRDITVRK